ncbi:hypothetical protein ACFOLC_13625 [Lysobacter cavernae]|uniref:DUF1440 domain-containing protein n=1 Tax=Lysobacter cavernae TaxID=1685901 RepID=A0ABV7RRB3_9GAMM
MQPIHRNRLRSPGLLSPGMVSPTLWLLTAGLVAATLDILYATGFWALRGVDPTRVWQSIAAGLLGKASFSGGADTATLGLALHYLIALAMAAAYFIAARRLPKLWQQPWRYGALYGLLLYAVMNLIVVPLSAAPGGGAKPMLWVVLSLLAHVLLVGLPIAWCARRAYGLSAPLSARRRPVPSVR